MQDGVYDEFARKFTAGTAVTPIGNSFDKGIVIGPMAKASAHDKAEERLQDADRQGRKGGHRQGSTRRWKLFYAPTVLSDAARDMAIFEEETFGPVEPLFRFKGKAYLINMANDSEFGLTS